MGADPAGCGCGRGRLLLADRGRLLAARNVKWPFPVICGRRHVSAGTGINNWEANDVSILWIILIVILVLALLGFFSRGRW
jgi:hypothetical protein